tara:strand:+ start:792459 stop:792620 length:162 start_codon:yes stop_codon:yes gene_type:complete
MEMAIWLIAEDFGLGAVRLVTFAALRIGLQTLELPNATSGPCARRALNKRIMV